MKVNAIQIDSVLSISIDSVFYVSAINVMNLLVTTPAITIHK